ncbi:MAG: hypothetical protein LBU27_02910 [Candidatus Peribacteria bacterium]|jgi:phage host-nuclease inhibitor protein Gam|nr:hypothetical protein [Candidatus Peribacteria bacterium]
MAEYLPKLLDAMNKRLDTIEKKLDDFIQIFATKQEVKSVWHKINEMENEKKIEKTEKGKSNTAIIVAIISLLGMLVSSILSFLK